MNFLIYFTLLFLTYIFAENEISEFEQPEGCGTQATNWKPCIERRIADQVFTSCCERFVPPECRGLCIYESNAIESRVILMHTIQPSRCRLYKYLSSIVHCAAQTHDNTECCKDMGLSDIGPQCLQLCHPQAKPRAHMGERSLAKPIVSCLSKWDQIMQCHHSGLRARKVPKTSVLNN
uniref:DB domain-containing protein n=1 Tax=Strongyloides venezuelensis TaxID=75913 RepID=A0A0K0EY46_STRVS